MTTTGQIVVAAVAGVGTGTVAFTVMQAFRPPTLKKPVRRARRRVDTTLLVAAIVAATVVLLLTRWPIAAAGVGALVVFWPTLFPTEAARQRRRLEGIAKWLEDLRDLQQGSGLDLIETLDHASRRAPASIAPELTRFAAATGHHTPLADALVDLADDLDHPVADAAVAAMLFAAGDASGSSLGATFSMLAENARDELVARDRIDRMRLNFQRQMRRMIVILAALIGYLIAFSGDTLDPYNDIAGQVWLIVPITMWATALWWLRRLSRYERIGRYISRQRIDGAVPT